MTRCLGFPSVLSLLAIDAESRTALSLGLTRALSFGVFGFLISSPL